MMASPEKIDINTASIQDFEQLIGVGHCKAEAIVKHRKSVGGFSSISDISRVPGVGYSILDVNRGRLSCGSATAQRNSRRGRRGNLDKSPSSSRSLGRRSASARRGGSTVRTRQQGSSEEQSQSLNAPIRSPGASVRSPGPSVRSPGPSTRSQVLSATRAHGVCIRSPYANLRSQQNQDVPLDGPSSSFSRQDGGIHRHASSAQADSSAERSKLYPHHEVRNQLAERVESDTGTDDETHAEDSHVEEGEEGEEMDNRMDDLAEEPLGRSSFIIGRSRIPIPISGSLRGNLMKRKSNSNRDHLTPGKRLCKSGSYTSHAAYRNLKHSLPIQRQRIPSKENPPTGLAQWLQTFQSWGNAERLMAVDELIKLCDPTQVRHMMQVIEPQFQRDFISLLPKELALYVLSFLEPKDLLQAAQTCRYWRVLAEDNLLWREKCHDESIDEALVFGSNRFRRRQGSPRSPWKCLYMRQHQIEQNWRSGPIRPPKVLKGHDDHVITCLEFHGNRIVSGSDDNTLKVWSALTGKCLRTLVGHTGGVWSSQMHGNTIISGSTDRTLKVWNADSGQCIHTLYGHTSTVRCMHLNESKVVSGSRDATLRVWDVETGNCLHVLQGHVAAVRCVQYDGKRVVSGAYDYMVKVWDPETETCLHTLQGHTNRVYSLQFDGVHIVSGSLDTSIRVWDVETGNCLHTLIGHQSLTSGLELKDNILVSGNADSTVKVWDITTGQCLQTLQGPNKHQSAVTCLQFNKRFVITSSDDGTVKIWDLKSGEFLRNLVALESGGSGGVVWRVRCNNTKLVCAVGSRNGTEETKLLVLDFDVEDKKTSV
ncbi:hypothetical protein ACJMK2_032877 [Sinanodonta woodiana]|uniref:F-box/WD repeat-containing protein 7 n=1 Tax=Sinanodonta woodiana TaxID=1069815 RepID=A0ABD3X3B3_SINWO